MICLVWIYLDLVYQLECLRSDIRRLCAFVFYFIFIFLCPFVSWSNPRFDQDLNKFKTWKWKGKHVSFLISHSKMKLLGRFLKFPCLKSKTTSLRAWLHKTKFRARGRNMIFLIWICLDLVYELECLRTIWHKKAICFGFSFFLKFYAHLNLDQILGTVWPWFEQF